MDQDSADIGTTRRNLLCLLGGSTVLVASRHVFAQQAEKQALERKATMKVDRNGSRVLGLGPGPVPVVLAFDRPERGVGLGERVVERERV